MAGEFTANVTTSVKLGSFTIGGVSQSLLGDQIIDVSKVIPAGAINQSVILAIPVDSVQVMALETDTDCTITTNGTGGSAVDTLVMKAKIPLIWHNDQPTATRFFSADVTGLYVTTTGVTSFKFGALLDIFPNL